MFKKKQSDIKSSLQTLETQASILDPDQYHSIIHTIIARIRQKYNGPQLKELMVNINRLEEYNFIKLARYNQCIEREAAILFKLNEIEGMLEKYNTVFLNILQNSPDYRLDDLYQRFVTINNKLASLDTNHAKVFKSKNVTKINSPTKKILPKSNLNPVKTTWTAKQHKLLLRQISSLQEQIKQLKQQIQIARGDTQTVIKQLNQCRLIQTHYQNTISKYQQQICQFQRNLSSKEQIIKQKDQLFQNYKLSIQKLKLSLYTPTKLTKHRHNKQFQHQLTQRINTTVETAIKKALQSNTRFKTQPTQQQSFLLNSHNLSFSPIDNRTPKLTYKKKQQQDLWDMLLIQSVSLEQMLQQ